MKAQQETKIKIILEDKVKKKKKKNKKIKQIRNQEEENTYTEFIFYIKKGG